MKTVFLVIVVAILGLGALYLTQTAQPTLPESANEATTQAENETSDPAAETESAEVSGIEVESESGNVEVESTADADLEAADTSAEADAPAGEEVVIDISGTNYAYDVEEIRVNEGDTVTINFESAEGFHDWVVDEFDAATERVQTGGQTSVTFVADEAGTYEYYCSVGNHRAQGMVGTLIVQ